MNYFSAALLLISVNAFSASSSGFSCESIKEKSVKSSCIKDRESKNKSDSEEEKKNKADLAEKMRVNKLVIELKELLTKDFKDPMSAQFTELVFKEDAGNPALCGKVNAKNSYGGYIGARDFYILKMNNFIKKKIEDPEKAELTEELRDIEIQISKIICSNAYKVQ